MGLVDTLVKLGGKLGVLKIVAAPADASQKKIATRKVTLKELQTEIQAQEVQLLAEEPAELSVEFAKVFEAAGIKPLGGGWTVDKLGEVLRRGELRHRTRLDIQAAVLEMMARDNARVQDVVADAMARDRAIDAFEVFARRKYDERLTALQRKEAELESQIRDLQGRLAGLAQDEQAQKTQWTQWHDKKVQYEKEMAWALGFLLDKPAITIDQDHD